MKKRAFDEMNDSKMQRELQEGEKILWQGVPERFPLMHEGNRKKLIRRWILCALLFAAVTAAYLAMAARAGLNGSWAVTAVALLVFAYVAAVPVLDARKVMGKCSYYITDRRAVTIVEAKETLAVPVKNIKYRYLPVEDGCTHLLLGSAASLPERKLLFSTFVPQKAETGEEIIGLVFYQVKDTPRLRELFP